MVRCNRALSKAVLNELKKRDFAGLRDWTLPSKKHLLQRIDLTGSTPHDLQVVDELH